MQQWQNDQALAQQLNLARKVHYAVIHDQMIPDFHVSTLHGVYENPLHAVIAAYRVRMSIYPGFVYATDWQDRLDFTYRNHIGPLEAGVPGVSMGWGYEFRHPGSRRMHSDRIKLVFVYGAEEDPEYVHGRSESPRRVEISQHFDAGRVYRVTRRSYGSGTQT